MEIESGPRVVACKNLADAMEHAQGEMMGGSCYIKFCQLVRQGTRQFISTTFTYEELSKLVTQNDTPKGGNPLDYEQRTIIPEHKESIKNYVIDNDTYILPGLVLNCSEPVTFYTIGIKSASPGGFAVIPTSATMQANEGMHRKLGIIEAVKIKPEILGDSVPIMLTFEEDKHQRFQDFADMAKTRQISASLKAIYDQRGESKIVHEVLNHCEIFKGRTEMVGSRPKKNSNDIFTMGNVRESVYTLLFGEWVTRSKGAEIGRSGDDISRHIAMAKLFFNQFTEQNEQWSEVLRTPVRQLVMQDYRAKYLHFLPGGLKIMSGVGTTILKQPEDQWESKITSLAQLNWARNSPIWQGNVVHQSGDLVTNRSQIFKAVALIKKTIDLPLSATEEESLKKTAENDAA